MAFFYNLKGDEILNLLIDKFNGILFVQVSVFVKFITDSRYMNSEWQNM